MLEKGQNIEKCDNYRFCGSNIHVDEFGFIHELKTEGLQLHQAAQQLLRHYGCAQEEHENHARRWRSMMEEMSGEGAVNKRVNLEKSFKKLLVKHNRCVVKL